MADNDLAARRVLAIVTNYGVEQDELVVPVDHLRDGGAEVVVAAASDDSIQTLVGDKDPGKTVEPDTTIDAVDDSDYDLLLIPGGALNADHLRMDDDALGLIKAFTSSGRPVAAICHAPWTLIEADVVDGKRLTSYASLQTDVRNAGGSWVDEEVVTDDTDGWTLVTSRTPDDLDAFLREVDNALSARVG
jgi:deglycase